MDRDVLARIVAHIMVTPIFVLCGAVALAASLPRRAGEKPPLYSYHRTNDDVTRVEIGAPRADAPQISPRIFSNFLEHLGGAVYDGLWANAVQNPQFAADRRGTLAYWRMRDGARWEDATAWGKWAAIPAGSRVTQLINLPVHRELRYRGSLWCRTLGGSSSTMEISLRRGDKPPVIAAARIDAGAEWRKHSFQFALPSDALRPGETAEIEIRCAQGEAAVGMVELFPADAVDGVDPDVLKAAKALNIALLRWPGGNFVSGYHWRDGVGPREQRPTVPNPAWGGLETHHFGTDEFLSFCRRIGAKPQISVNAGNGTPDEAAAWVEYCNGSTETPMGALRTKNGHSQPYNVRVWEIGNELYGDWQIGHVDAAGNADRFVHFRDAMLNADPTIEIIATGKGDEFVGAGLKRDDDWNRQALSAAFNSGAASPAYLSLHPLVPLPENLPRRYSYDEIYASAMAHPQWWSQSYVPAVTAQIAGIEGRANAAVPSPNLPTRLAVTEWGIIVGGPQWLRYPNHDAQSGAVYAALFFHAMLRHADVVGLSNVTALMHGGGIKRPNSIVYVDPMYHIEKLYGVARPEQVLPVRVSGPGYDAPARGFLPAANDVPWLDVFAARHGTDWQLFVVNRDAAQARRAEIRIPSAPRNLTADTQTAPPQQGNSAAKPNTVSPRPVEITVHGTLLTHTFPPCSVTLIRWRKS